LNSGILKKVQIVKTNAIGPEQSQHDVATDYPQKFKDVDWRKWPEAHPRKSR
jgi:hypothetical protein